MLASDTSPSERRGMMKGLQPGRWSAVWGVVQKKTERDVAVNLTTDRDELTAHVAHARLCRGGG